VLFSIATRVWKVTDFGLTSEGTSTGLRSSRYGRGKHCYRAPELVRESNMSFNNKADLWALGCILYELIANQKAFSDDYDVLRYARTPNLLQLGEGETYQSLSTFYVPALLALDPMMRPSVRKLKPLSEMSRALVKARVFLPTDFRLDSPLGSALDWAARNSYLHQMTGLLSELGAQQYNEDSGDVILQLAVRERLIDVVAVLIEAGAESSRALFVASCSGDIHGIEILLEAGANIHDVDEKGRTALSLAASHGCADAVKLLVKAGDVHISDDENLTPMHWACRSGRIAVLDALLSQVCSSGYDSMVTGSMVAASVKSCPLYSNGAEDWFAISNSSQDDRKLQFSERHSFHHPFVVSSIAFSPDGLNLCAASGDSAYIYEMATGTKVATLVHDVETRGGFSVRVDCVGFVGDGTSIACSGNRIIYVWNISAGRVKTKLIGHQANVTALDVCRWGRRLASASSDGKVRLWELPSGNIVWTVICYGVTSIALSPDANLLASASNNKGVRILSTTNGHVLTQMNGHTDKVTSVSFLADGKAIVSASKDDTMRVWQLPMECFQSPRRGSASEESILKYEIRGHNISGNVTSSPDGSWIVDGNIDCGVRFWGSGDGQLHSVLYEYRRSGLPNFDFIHDRS